jgi:hypothetical protein
METMPAAVSSQLFTDRELLELLRTEEDRLPRSIVDEFVRRGAALAEPLARICREERFWRESGPAAWVPVHASFILGAIGGDLALPALSAALSWAARTPVHAVTDALPSIFGSRGRAATAPLKMRILDPGALPLERALAVECLGAVAARTPIEQGEVLDFLRALAEDDAQPQELRAVSAHVLLRFLRPGDRPVVLSAALRQEWGDGVPLFTREEAEQAYAAGTRDLGEYFLDWLSFYGVPETETRVRRSRARAEDARWRRGVREAEGWVEAERAELLRRFEWTLADLDDAARGDAVWIADSATEYLVWHERVAPWRWTAKTAYAYLMDVFARRLALDDPGRSAAVPANLLRFARFCADEGRLDADELRAAEACIREESDEIVGTLRDPERRRAARSTMAEILAHGVDPADRVETGVWLRSGRRPEAAPELPAARASACPCGSGRRFRLCCA